jgi:O6-methylguanine-DNA--protein-cysteine methyltransferase|tara:strand:- start:586 stop:825 length:240 start_codon:yes stop_codon:yes gene_type:complete
MKDEIFSYLKTLGKGETVTYKFLADKFGSRPRAVAMMLKGNKDKSVPCYKVIMSSGKLGGYNGLLGKSKEELILGEVNN